MPVILVRIDDRLIHGQIVEGWLKPIKANHILIVSEEVAKDKMQQILLGMAVPAGVKLTAVGVEDAAAKLKAGLFEKDNTLLLVSGPQYVLELVKRRIDFKSVNVGGMHYSAGKKQISRTLSVNDEEITALMDLHKAGIELEGRILPGDDRTDVYEILRKELNLP